MKKHTNFDIGLIIFIAIYNLGIIAFSLAWIFTKLLEKSKESIFGELNDENILIQFSYFFFSGLIGGAFYCLRALYQRLSDAYTPQYIDNVEDLPDPNIIFNVRVWLLWYLYRPIQGGILAIIIVCLFNQGLIGLNGLEPENISSIFFQVGIGFLVGFGTHEVINKVEEVIRVLFSKSSKNQSKPREETQKKIKENEKIKQ
ncbi:hypothetical protein [Tenacibaculum finnmarkense]|uniref:hypothetical protein n=1 Tax=Tenacibaculum finnmarkense TaxID=2781243 RepID=UPI001EFA83B1|nr:hypothetical protein [Tenacibaculum finnmarkense]MCG8238784.1 hypothetical protein [Tenacibaculum finnmarkense genomovar ulcerans]MCG8808864.1 hypothetical protein [Tenacibaculum finnmarkense]MCG8819101.1 hypothetical protein [Tenacibaculum finnmarkense]